MTFKKFLNFKLSRVLAAHRHRRDNRRAMFEFYQTLKLIADPGALVALIAARIKELFDTDRLIILRAFTEGGVFTIAYSTGYKVRDLENVHLTQRDRLAKWLLTNESAMVIEQDQGVFNYLSQSERDMLLHLDARVCVPLIALNQLTGLVLLSSTREGWRLDEEDLSLLQMLTSQANIAFEYAYLYEQQRERLHRLYRAEQLASAGQLAASVAHEIRNPLTAIRSTIQFLLSELDENNPKHSLMEGMISEVDRIDRTIDGLLSLTRRDIFKPERIDLQQVIEQTLMLVRMQARSQSVEIDCRSPVLPLYVMGDISQLKQLFLNLMLNALQAMMQGGRLKVELGSEVEQLDHDVEKSVVQVLITDTGCGILAENIEKVFDPFFTTKQAGTGLGLSVSYGIVRQHGGHLNIYSRHGEGTTVAVKLPLKR